MEKKVNPKKIQVLLVEDNPGDVRMVREMTREIADLEIHDVDHLSACMEQLESREWDVVLLDLGLPDSQGLETLRTIMKTGCSVPVVVLTSHDDDTIGRMAVREGAQDYLIKGIVPGQALTRAVHYAIERKIAERQERLFREVLELLNRPGTFKTIVGDILLSIKKNLGMDAVGLRLRDGEDFTYFFTSGFSEDFVCSEYSLCERDAGGEIMHDSRGNAVLACMCGNVIRGRTDPTLPFFTQGGSFWTNSTTRLLAGTTETDRQSPTRNRCNGEGYESMALVPIKSGDTILGLLQLDDRKTNRFTAEAIRFLESLGSSIGIAIYRMEAEKDRQESELRYRRLFESAKDGILILDEATGTVTDVNPFLIDLLGYSKEAFLGKKIWELSPFKDSLGNRDNFEELRRNQYIRYEDKPLEKADGKKVSVEFVSNVYLVDRSKVIQCNIRDITGRKLAEKEREGLEEKLRMSQKMEAIGRLAGGIAHDFNNLLSVILSYTDFSLEAVPENISLRDDLLEVRKAAERATALTRQLLAFSRKQVLQPVPLDLNKVIEGIQKMLERILGEDITLTHEFAPDLGLVLADPGQVEQVIMNLVINARDAMPEGGTLSVETRNVGLGSEYATLHPPVIPGSYVEFAVSDSGTGMDEQTKKRIFEPFFTTKEMGKGTGLGLSTVYGIVKQSNGFIWVYSEPGQGTSFKIYLPRLENAMVTAVEPRENSSKRSKTGTILIVEDEEPLRKASARILAETGYTVLVACDGEDAIKVCAGYQGDIALLLTDVVMPRMSGRILVQNLAGTRPGLKVLFMSGYTDNAIANHGILEQGTNFIGKPFSKADLLRKVDEVLGHEANMPGPPPPY